MAKRSINFENFKNKIPFSREILGSDALKREITQKRDALKRTFTDKRDALSRDGTVGGRSLALAKTHKVAVAGIATLGAAAVALSIAPHSSAQASTADAAPAAYSVTSGKQLQDMHASVTSQGAAADQKAELAAAHQKAAKKAKPVYADNLDGWIRESLSIMKKHHIPGTYNGLYRNIIRESSGNPMAINLWDINAQNGIPSKGLLQVIPPTFQTYHVTGTSWNIYNPVANITAAANYAADRYGTMDNVNSAY